jgi:hypothetical protein
MNLFASMILQSLVRLVIYGDQMIVRQQVASPTENIPSAATDAVEGGSITVNNYSSESSVSSSNEVWGIDNTVSILFLNFSKKAICIMHWHIGYRQGPGSGLGTPPWPNFIPPAGRAGPLIIRAGVVLLHVPDVLDVPIFERNLNIIVFETNTIII